MRLAFVIPHADMRCRQPGLWFQASEYLKHRGRKLEDLKLDDFLVFLNSRCDYVAILGKLNPQDRYGVLTLWKSPSGRVPLESIRFIAKCFGAGGRVDMDQAVKMGLELLLSRRKQQPSEESKKE